MNDFITLGNRTESEIIDKLLELGDDDGSIELDQSSYKLEGLLQSRSWLSTQHQYGFIPKSPHSSDRFQTIQSTSSIQPQNELINRRINIRLDCLHIYDYPKSIFAGRDNVHTILFSFEAKNQTQDGIEVAAFNQTYNARSGQDAGVLGAPVFIGLSVGRNGVSFSCKTVNIGSSDDQDFVKAINSEGIEKGLQLLTVAQPALSALGGIARGLCNVLAERSKNVAVQHFTLGLDFDKGSTGARLAIGSYIVAQVSRADEINWEDWKYDSQTGAIVRTNLAPNEATFTLPYNAVVFRVSRYQE